MKNKKSGRKRSNKKQRRNTQMIIAAAAVCIVAVLVVVVAVFVGFGGKNSDEDKLVASGSSDQGDVLDVNGVADNGDYGEIGHVEDGDDEGNGYPEDAAQGGGSSSKNGTASASKNGKSSSGSKDGDKAVVEDSVNSAPLDQDVPDGTAWRTMLGNNSGSGSGNGNTGNREEEVKNISFPYNIPNTNLTVQKISSYDGIYLEDGSDSNVSGVASVVIKNNGGSAVEYAKVTLNSDGKALTFEVSDIPAGSSVVAQEAGKGGYHSGPYTECSADVAEIGGLEMSSNQVKVEENADGSLTVSNVSGEEIPCVRVFYKFYMEDENAYVGGITYNVKVTDLGAGESQNVVPSHYSDGYSQVVMVRTYDTAD